MNVCEFLLYVCCFACILEGKYHVLFVFGYMNMHLSAGCWVGIHCTFMCVSVCVRVCVCVGVYVCVFECTIHWIKVHSTNICD